MSAGESPDYFRESLPDEQRLVYDQMPTGAGLAVEIKISRFVLAWLGQNVDGNHPAIIRLLTMLFRVLQLQARGDGSEDEIRRLVADAAQYVLESVEGDGAAEPAPVVPVHQYSLLDGQV